MGTAAPWRVDPQEGRMGKEMDAYPMCSGCPPFIANKLAQGREDMHKAAGA